MQFPLCILPGDVSYSCAWELMICLVCVHLNPSPEELDPSVWAKRQGFSFIQIHYKLATAKGENQVSLPPSHHTLCVPSAGGLFPGTPPSSVPSGVRHGELRSRPLLLFEPEQSLHWLCLWCFVCRIKGQEAPG